MPLCTPFSPSKANFSTVFTTNNKFHETDFTCMKDMRKVVIHALFFDARMRLG